MSEGKDFSNYAPPTFDVVYMKQVYLTAERSKDPSTKIGSVLVKEKNIIGTGYNGFARKVLDLPERYNDKETKYKFVVHSEANAILTCARLGISTLNSILYTQAFPCNECMKSIIQGGIKKIVIHKQWPNMNSKWIESMEISKIMMEESGIEFELLDKELNMIGYLNGKTINV
jgi:dCMP deaminase